MGFFVYILIYCVSFLTETKFFTNNIHGVVKNESGQGIPNVHVYYLGDLKKGTITNEDGEFSIQTKFSDDTLYLSHIAYLSKKIAIEEIHKDLSIIMQKSNISLPEVKVRSLTGRQIMKEALGRLKENHNVDPEMYEFYTRIIQYDKDSVLHLIEEHTGYVKISRLHFNSYQIANSRIKEFTKTGKREIEDRRMVAFSKMESDNLFRFREDYLRKGKSRRYTYRYVDDAFLFGEECYVIDFETDRDTYYKKGKLYIDKSCYAVLKKQLLDYDNNRVLKEVEFMEVGKQYYPRKAYEDFHMMNGMEEQRVTLYNLAGDPEGIKSEKFTSIIGPKKIKEFDANPSEDFWDAYLFIPLPVWVEEQL